MNDDRLLITDGVHTENTEGNGGPQADDGGEQVSIIRTSFILSGAHQATQVSD